MAKSPGNFYCIPSGSVTSASARKSLQEVQTSARAMRTLIKKYQARATIPGVPRSISEAYAFADRSTDGFHSFDLPFTQVDLSAIQSVFKRTSDGQPDLNFLKQMSRENFPALDALQVIGADYASSRYFIREAQGLKLVQSNSLLPSLMHKEGAARIPHGFWGVLYKTLDTGKYIVLIYNDTVSRSTAEGAIRSVTAKQGASKKRIDASTLTDSLFSGDQISIFVCPVGDLANARNGRNAYKYFKYDSQGIPNPVTPSSITVPARLITSSSFTASVDALEGYGPEFKGIRPPGTPFNFMLAYQGERVSARSDFIPFVNSLIAEDVSLINAAESKSLTAGLFKLPAGIVNDSDIIFSVVARATNTYKVSMLAYDRRPTSDGRANISNPPAGTLVNDPGPFGQERGVDSSGKAIVEGPNRPMSSSGRILKKYDDRVGAVASVYREETTEAVLINPDTPVTGSKLKSCHDALKSFLSTQGLEAFDILKVLSIAMYRVRALADGKYKPYVDFVTAAMMFEIKLGKNLLDGYADSPALVANNLIQANFRGYFPARDVQSMSTWGASQVRNQLPLFGYNNLTDVPAWSDGTDVTNKELFLPQGSPSSPDVLVYFGLEQTLPVSTSFKNWSDEGVRHFGRTHTSNRNNVVNLIAIHWGGSTGGHRVEDGNVPNTLYSSNLSTHFVVGHTGKITQHCDIGVKAWHIGRFNSPSIGIDTASPGFPYRARNGFSQVNKDAYAALGYRVISSPIFPSVGGVYVGRADMYESLFSLVTTLSELDASGRIEMPSEEAMYPGIFNAPEGKAVYTTSGMLRYANPPIAPIGVVPHMYTDASRTDDIVAYIYLCLRSLGDSANDAYRRLVLTLEGPLKQTSYRGKHLRYLVLNRS